MIMAAIIRLDMSKAMPVFGRYLIHASEKVNKKSGILTKIAPTNTKELVLYLRSPPTMGIYPRRSVIGIKNR